MKEYRIRFRRYGECGVEMDVIGLPVNNYVKIKTVHDQNVIDFMLLISKSTNLDVDIFSKSLKVSIRNNNVMDVYDSNDDINIGSFCIDDIILFYAIIDMLSV